ncbi:alpha/beta fold hydrolase [Aquamicrobium sp. LC103]|uniref:alpha/beta fold hydrolase n=1 Tax=Aquamicrobium sp. LC103 TaxID=1120658 RepID=UPI00063EAFD4|nr:alpha/beta fold hydrolase [Aquamicrobium sp. LC103]TKT77371.1 alpha/beta fold hydrolase [Aquamicrobium sp. LC103]
MQQSLYAVQKGESPAKLVFLHGFGGSHRVWRGLQEALAPETSSLAYDLPGHGASLDWPEAGPAKIAVKAVLADLAARGLDRVHLVGHSMGGAIAALMAISEPARIASATLLSPGGFGPEINARLLARFAAARDKESLRACLEGMFGWTSPVPDEAVGAAMEGRRQPGAIAMLRKIAEIIAPGGSQGEIARDRLAALAMPVSVVWGGLDNVLPARQCHNLPPHFARHLLPDRGHMLPDEAPEEVLRVIRRNIAGS